MGLRREELSSAVLSQDGAVSYFAESQMLSSLGYCSRTEGAISAGAACSETP